MGLPSNINNLKDVGLFSFADDEQGNIEVAFNISEAGDYKLIISESDLKSMKLMSEIGKRLNS